MKKSISVLIALTMIFSSVNIAFPVFADTEAELDTVVDELSELYREETAQGKDIETSAESRIIVKADIKPDTYGNAEMISGTDDIYIYQYETAEDAANALEYYNSLSYVKWAETDGIVKSQGYSYSSDNTFSYSADMIGSKYAKQYLETKNTPEVNIALIDAGINFKLKSFKDTNRVIDSGINLSDTGNEGTAQQDSSTEASACHGSNITSILLDNTSSNINIIGYKAMNRDGLGTETAVATCVEKAVEDGADIINLSLGGPFEMPLLQEAIKNAYDKGVICVIAAGNDNDDVSYYYPANMDEVFTVGAIDYRGNPCYFSDYGEEIDFVAPGFQVEVYGNNSSLDEPTYVNGCSYATPFITAASAVALSVYPDYSIEDIKQVLIDSCVTKDKMTYSSQYLSAVEISNDSLLSFTSFNLGDKAESVDLYYGYGMPQMQKIVGIADECTSPSFSVSSGKYHNEFQLSLTAAEGAKIYYTTDGSYPTSERSKLYTSPLTISSTTSIRAVAYEDNKTKSSPSSAEYKMEYYAEESNFSIDERGYITGYTGEKNEIIVPDTINGVTVKGVAENAFYDDFDPAEAEENQQAWDKSEHLLGIVLPETVEVIEDYSFFSFIVRYFTAPGLKSIGEGALCTPLVYLDAPNIESIGAGGLMTELTEINLPKLKNADTDAFSENKYLRKVILPSLETIPNSAFNSCYRLEEARFDSATEIIGNAFYKCHFLRNCYAPNVVAINDINSTFENCANLKTISFPNLESMTTTSCFKNCSSLQEINFPKLLNIPKETFSNCYSLSKINIPNVEQIDYRAFYSAVSLGMVELNSLKYLGDEAFVNASLQSFSAPELVTLGKYAFTNFDRMTDAWVDSPNLITLIIPNVETAVDYAFAYLSGLTELDLPNLKTIGENAFYESGVNYLYAPELQTAESLPVAENSVVVVSDKLTSCTFEPTDKTLTIQGVKDSYSQEYADLNGLEFIDVDAMGGSIRVTDAGLRFGYSFYDTQKKNVEEYGFVYAQGEKENNEITVNDVDSSNVLQLTAYNRLTHEDETTTYNLVFTDIPITAYDTKVSARAYVKIDEIYYYSDTLCFSFNDIAQKVLSDNEIDQNTKNSLKNLLEV